MRNITSYNGFSLTGGRLAVQVCNCYQRPLAGKVGGGLISVIVITSYSAADSSVKVILLAVFCFSSDSGVQTPVGPGYPGKGLSAVSARRQVKAIRLIIKIRVRLWVLYHATERGVCELRTMRYEAASA